MFQKASHESCNFRRQPWCVILPPETVSAILDTSQKGGVLLCEAACIAFIPGLFPSIEVRLFTFQSTIRSSPGTDKHKLQPYLSIHIIPQQRHKACHSTIESSSNRSRTSININIKKKQEYQECRVTVKSVKCNRLSLPLSLSKQQQQPYRRTTVVKSSPQVTSLDHFFVVSGSKSFPLFPFIQFNPIESITCLPWQDKLEAKPRKERTMTKSTTTNKA